MSTRSSNTFASGPSWNRDTWKVKALHDLARSGDVVIPAWTFGVPLMAELTRAGVFERGFPPDSGDTVIIDFGDEWVAFNVFKVRDKWQCIEDRDANPRVLRLTDEDLTPCTLRREAFYVLMAGDLGLTGPVTKLQPGVWELGRKSLPGCGRSKVVFVEARVSAAEVALYIAQDQFLSFCILSAGTGLSLASPAGKSVVASVVTVSDGRFASEVFEDLVASQAPAVTDTSIDLTASPPKLWISGREFSLPNDRGRPTLGVLYLAELFDCPREAVSCWDIERKVNPRLKETSSVSFGADARIDNRAQRELDEGIRAAKTELDDGRREFGASESEIAELEDALERLLEQKQADTGKAGKSRTLGTPDKERARQRVRKALDAVFLAVEKQAPEVGRQLRAAVGEGGEILFTPPPDWGI